MAKDTDLTEVFAKLKARTGKRSEEDIKAYEKALEKLKSPVIEDFQKNIEEAAGIPVQLSLLPTDLCRTSVFRPLRRSDIGSANEKAMSKAFSSNWGEISFYGPDLGMLEEDLLIELLRLWVIKGGEEFPIKQASLLDRLGYKRQKNKRHRNQNYNRLKEALQRLNMSNLRVVFFKTKGGAQETGINVLQYKWKEKQLVISISSWFVGTIGRGLVTGINLDERRQIKGDIAKCLHRFLSAERELTGSHNIFHLAGALGMNMSQQERQLRRLIKNAVTELKRIGFLTGKTRFKGDVLNWERAQFVLSGPKLVKSIKG